MCCDIFNHRGHEEKHKGHIDLFVMHSQCSLCLYALQISVRSVIKTNFLICTSLKQFSI